jgi:hypothetical protein
MRPFWIVDKVASIVYFLCSECTVFLAPPATIIFTVPVKVIVMLPSPSAYGADGKPIRTHQLWLVWPYPRTNTNRFTPVVFGRLLAAVNLYVDFNGVDHGVLRLYCIGFRGVHCRLHFSKVNILAND